VKSFIKALRAPFVLISGLNFFSLWYACALPLNPIFFLGLTGILLAHLSSNLWNDYFDFTADSLNQTPTVFSGGSRVLQDGEITKRSFLIFSIILSFISLVIGILLIFMATRPAATLLVITTTSLIGFFYTAPPLRLVYRGFGGNSSFLFVSDY
jgi:1,4-dihydroxy-2-naphthoate octaprenyltransferase